MQCRFLMVGLIGLGAMACSGDDPSPSPEPQHVDPGCAFDSDCGASPEAPVCDVASAKCTAFPPGYEIGWRGGTADTVALVPIYQADEPRTPTDLAFNPDKPTEMWITNHLDDSVIIVEDPGLPDESWERRRDPAAGHFMPHPPAIAFGATSPEWGPTFAVCPDADNSGENPQDPTFMGPALFSADLDIFAEQTPDGLGSHIDMLHSTSFCRGIAHVLANIYFVFNSQKKSLDKYDFHKDHGPGNDDHSDGEIFRYVQGAVAGVKGVPSHLAYSPEDLGLYVADTGNQRIARLDTTSGTIGATFPGEEPASRRLIDGAVITDVVPAGNITSPSGIELHGGLLYVTDSADSRFLVYDMNGQFVRALVTGLPAGTLAGFNFGPEDGKIYFVDMLGGGVFRIDPLPSVRPEGG